MSIRILLVDDHKITRDGLNALIEKQGNMKVVGEAENGRDAVRLVKAVVPNVVIMDISMADLNGIDATKQILALSPSTKVIALSMYSDKRYVKGMLSAGASGYLLKSCAFDELVQAIMAVSGGHSFLSASIADMVMKDFAHDRAAAEEASVYSSSLSPREREVLQLIAEGNNSKQIALTLCISIKTVSTHRQRIMEKLQLDNIADLVKFALKEGLVSDQLD